MGTFIFTGNIKSDIWISVELERKTTINEYISVLYKGVSWE